MAGGQRRSAVDELNNTIYYEVPGMKYTRYERPPLSVRPWYYWCYGVLELVYMYDTPGLAVTSPVFSLPLLCLPYCLLLLLLLLLLLPFLLLSFTRYYVHDAH